GAGVAFFATFAKEKHGVGGLTSLVFFVGLVSMTLAVACGLIGWFCQVMFWTAWANELDPKKMEQHQRFEKSRRKWQTARTDLLVGAVVFLLLGVLAAFGFILQLSQ